MELTHLERLNARVTQWEVSLDRMNTIISEAERELRCPPRPDHDRRVHLQQTIQWRAELRDATNTTRDEIVIVRRQMQPVVNDFLFRVTTPEDMRTVLSMGADIQFRRQEGRPGETLTALQFHAWEGLHELVDVLLAHNAEVDAPYFGLTPLQHACEKGDCRLNVARSLLRGGASTACLAEYSSPPPWWNNGFDGILRIVRRASRLRSLSWLPILRTRGCELRIAVRLSPRLPAIREAQAVIFLTNVAPDDVFDNVASFL